MTIERSLNDPEGDVTPVAEHDCFTVEDLQGFQFSPVTDSVHRFANPSLDHIKYFKPDQGRMVLFKLSPECMNFLVSVAMLPETIRHNITPAEVNSLAQLEADDLDRELEELEGF